MEPIKGTDLAHPMSENNERSLPVDYEVSNGLQPNPNDHSHEYRSKLCKWPWLRESKNAKIDKISFRKKKMIRLWSVFQLHLITSSMIFSIPAAVFRWIPRMNDSFELVVVIVRVIITLSLDILQTFFFCWKFCSSLVFSDNSQTWANFAFNCWDG